MQSRPPHQPRPFHVLLFAAYAPLALLAANANQVAATDIFRPLLISLVLALVIYAIYFLLLRRPSRAALAATLTLIVFLSYGHLYNGLKLLGLPGETVVRHRYLLPVVLGLLAIAVFLAVRRDPPRQLASTLNLMGLALIAIPALTLVLNWGGSNLASSWTGKQPFQCSLKPAPGAPLPDVYFIVMDAYERDDVLREMHGSDITPFVEWLEGKGFYVARGSMSNYRHTELSIPTTLNMDYAQSLLGTDTPDEEEGRWRMVKMISDNRLRRELECIGYTTVGIETGVTWTEWRDADYFIAQDTDPLHSARLVGTISPFEGKYLDTTIARAILDGYRSRQGAAPVAVDPNEGTRQRILFAFDRSNAPQPPAPKLVFVHILCIRRSSSTNGEPISQADFETTLMAPARRVSSRLADQATYQHQAAGGSHGHSDIDCAAGDCDRRGPWLGGPQPRRQALQLQRHSLALQWEFQALSHPHPGEYIPHRSGRVLRRGFPTAEGRQLLLHGGRPFSVPRNPQYVGPAPSLGHPAPQSRPQRVRKPGGSTEHATVGQTSGPTRGENQMAWKPPTFHSNHDDTNLGGRRHGIPSLPKAYARLGLVVLLTLACGTLPSVPLPDFDNTLLGAVATLPPMPTLGFPEFDGEVLPPIFSLPEVPEGTIQPLIGSPPDWWYLVPIHRSAYAAGSNGRDYHYLVALPTSEVTDFYEELMGGGDWETFMGTIASGSASMMSYSRDGSTATIYISPHDGGSLVSIVIE
jgi:hypothetical protein